MDGHGVRIHAGAEKAQCLAPCRLTLSCASASPRPWPCSPASVPPSPRLPHGESGGWLGTRSLAPPGTATAGRPTPPPASRLLVKEHHPHLEPTAIPASPAVLRSGPSASPPNYTSDHVGLHSFSPPLLPPAIRASLRSCPRWPLTGLPPPPRLPCPLRFTFHAGR